MVGPGEGPLWRGGCSPGASPHLTPQLPLSSSHLNVYSGDPQVTASLVGVTSSSCPADLTQKRELTGTASVSACAPAPLPPCLSPSLSAPLSFPWPPDAESRALAKERQKKDNHNLSEPLPPPAPHPAPCLPPPHSHLSYQKATWTQAFTGALTFLIKFFFIN